MRGSDIGLGCCMAVPSIRLQTSGVGCSRSKRMDLTIQDEISRGIVNSLRLERGHGRRRYETALKLTICTFARGHYRFGSAWVASIKASSSSRKQSPKIPLLRRLMHWQVKAQCSIRYAASATDDPSFQLT
jgi:hypothetical protein